MKDNKCNVNKYIWIIILGIIITIIICNHVITMPTNLHVHENYEDFLIKYYTIQKNFLNIGLVILGIVLAYLGIIIPIDYKSKKEELENLLNFKLSKIDYVIELLNSDTYWYEKYRSGKLKQGGILYLNNLNNFSELYLTLPLAYRSKGYYLLYSIINFNKNSDIQISIKEKDCTHVIFRIHNYRQNDKQISINWQTSGF